MTCRAEVVVQRFDREVMAAACDAMRCEWSKRVENSLNRVTLEDGVVDRLGERHCDDDLARVVGG